MGGAPGQGVDFLHQAYAYFLPLIAAVLVLTYFLLMRAFRSAAAAQGGASEPALGRRQLRDAASCSSASGSARRCSGSTSSARSRVGVFLFAMLFGLSMDYEVFLVTRMRESWDEGRDNVAAVAHRARAPRRIITAAAIIMCRTFSGFVAGRIGRPAESASGSRSRSSSTPRSCAACSCRA